MEVFIVLFVVEPAELELIKLRGKIVQTYDLKYFQSYSTFFLDIVIQIVT